MKIVGVIGHQIGADAYEVDVHTESGRFRVIEKSTNVTAARAKAKRRMLREGTAPFEQLS